MMPALTVPLPRRSSRPDSRGRPGRGVSAVEMMVVCCLLTLIIAPTLSLFTSSQKTASSGYDNLEMLNRARQLMERVQRDLKGLCSTDGYGFLPVATATVAYSFPVFPTVAPGRVFADEVPLNLVTWVFDPAARTVTRTVRFHPLVAPGGLAQRSEAPVEHVASFTIVPRKMLGGRYYDIELACSSSQSKREVPPLVLRAAVRAVHEVRLQHHPYELPNRRPRFVFP